MGEPVTPALITKVEVYALFVDTPLGPAYVLIPDVSKAPGQVLRENFVVGQEVQVHLTRFVAELGMYQGRMYEGPRPI